MKKRAFTAAVLALLVIAGAAALFLFQSRKSLTISDVETGEVYARYPMKVGDGFSVSFVHSVNQSPVTDRYEIRRDGIYVVETAYGNFGAGVETELLPGETLSYGEHGEMIISGIDQKREPLLYIVGTVSDHLLCLHYENEDTAEEISLRDLCGRNAQIAFAWE